MVFSCLEHGDASAACVSFQMDNHPCKHHQHNDETTILACPVGFTGASCLAEKEALELPPAIINQNCNKYAHSRIFIVDIATVLDCHTYCQWIPAHVGIGPNEEANDIARLCVGTYPADIQKTIPIELKALKLTLKWIQHTPLFDLQTTTISIKKRHLVPWALQANIIFKMACGRSWELWCLPTSPEMDNGSSMQILWILM